MSKPPSYFSILTETGVYKQEIGLCTRIIRGLILTVSYFFGRGLTSRYNLRTNSRPLPLLSLLTRFVNFSSRLWIFVTKSKTNSLVIKIKLSKFTRKTKSLPSSLTREIDLEKDRNGRKEVTERDTTDRRTLTSGNNPRIKSV